MTDLLRTLLIRHEGVRLKIYTDTVGKFSIGVGRNLTDTGISQSEAMTLLDNDMARVLRDCQTFPWWAALDPVRQAVVASMIFNLGLAGFSKFHGLLAALGQTDYVAASQAMIHSQWSGQVRGRAVELAQMMQTGVSA